MDSKLVFVNHPNYNLQPGDEIYAIDEKIGLRGIIYIKRENESLLQSGIYSCNGAMLFPKDDNVEINIMYDSYLYGLGEEKHFYYQIKRGNCVGACTADGRLVLKAENRKIREFYHGVFVVLTANGKYAAYSESGEELLPAKYKHMSRDKQFIIAKNETEVSIICNGDVLVRDIPYKSISKYWSHIRIIMEDSVIICSAVVGYVGKFKGIVKKRFNECVEIINGKERMIINAVTGDIIIPNGEYLEITMLGSVFTAVRPDGTTTTGQAKW